MDRTIQLGLIGDNIGASQAPRLHQLAGRQNACRVTYDRLVPRERGMDFDALFDHVAEAGYRGINVTYPYKERAARRVQVDHPRVRAMGAVNTVLFGNGPPRGYNTDYSGFISAYRQARGDAPPGRVLLIGAGGVGRSLAFALSELGAAELRLVDTDPSRAAALAEALGDTFPALSVSIGADAEGAADGADGLVNATPIGMVGHDGTALPARAMEGAKWAFDAVYTPVETRFLGHATTAGLVTISGYELFIGQGLDAWQLFSELPIDEERLRAALASEEEP